MNMTITFQRPAIETAAVADAPLPMLRRFGAALRQRMRRFAMDPRTRYLSDACDHVDLENRMSAWQANEDRAAMFGRMI